MKKLTDTQKKWALTGCLTSVLSFNLVMSLTSPNYQSMNFASKFPPGKHSSEVAENLSGGNTKAPELKKLDRRPTMTAPAEEPTEENAKKVTTQASEAPQEEAPIEETQEETPATKQKASIKWARFVSTKGEVLKVKYIEDEGQTRAVIPKKVEGGLCYTCGKEYLLPAEFESSVGDLEVALRKAINVTATVNKSEVAEEEDLEPEVVSRKKQKSVEEDEDAPEEDPAFVDLKKKCENKEDDSRLDCFANGLTRLLQDKSIKGKKKKEFKREEVMALFKDEIQPRLMSGLKDVRDLLPSRRLLNDPFSEVATDETNRRKHAQALVEQMIAGISKKYNYLRQQLTTMAANAVLSNQEEAQRKFKQAEQIQQTNPSLALQLKDEGYARMRASSQSANEIAGTLYDGLSTAQWSDLITPDQFDNLYRDNYATLVQQAIQGLASNPLTYVIPSTTLSLGDELVDGSGNRFKLVPSTSPLTQQRTTGRGFTPISNGLTPVNSAQGAPRIVTVNGMATPGTATIQPLQAIQAPTVQRAVDPRLGR